MNPRVAPLTLAALLASGSVHAQAVVHRVDDGASRVLGGAVRMRWDDTGPRMRTVSGEVAVRVVLDVTPWQGRIARIYMVLAPEPAGRVDVRWIAQGPLLPGMLRDGERRLVYAGPITAPRIEDTQRLTITADGTRLTRPEELEFAFEIELESP